MKLKRPVSWLAPSACHSPFVSVGAVPGSSSQTAGRSRANCLQVKDENPEGARKRSRRPGPAGPHGQAQPTQPLCLSSTPECSGDVLASPPLCLYATESSAVPEPSCRSGSRPAPAGSQSCSAKDSEKETSAAETDSSVSIPIASCFRWGN